MQLQSKDFLETFVKELILNSVRRERIETEDRYYKELKTAIDLEKKFLEKIKELEKREGVEGTEKDRFKMPILMPTPQITKLGKPEMQKPMPMPMALEKNKIRKPLAIPLVRHILPPQPEEALGIDLSKINSIISDPTVKAIECAGPDNFLVIQGIIGKKVTNIKLNEEEIKEVINKFSEKTKIPVIKGIFRAVSGNLMISAVISELAGFRFVIRKIQKQRI